MTLASPPDTAPAASAAPSPASPLARLRERALAAEADRLREQEERQARQVEADPRANQVRGQLRRAILARLADELGTVEEAEAVWSYLSPRFQDADRLCLFAESAQWDDSIVALRRDDCDSAEILAVLVRRGGGPVEMHSWVVPPLYVRHSDGQVVAGGDEAEFGEARPTFFLETFAEALLAAEREWERVQREAAAWKPPAAPAAEPVAWVGLPPTPDRSAFPVYADVAEVVDRGLSRLELVAALCLCGILANDYVVATHQMRAANAVLAARALLDELETAKQPAPGGPTPCNHKVPDDAGAGSNLDTHDGTGDRERWDGLS